MKMAGRLGAAPSKLSFGDSVAQAGAWPTKKIGAVERTAPRWVWRKPLFNHNRESKRAGSFVLPARAISIKNKHLLVVYSTPTRGFTAAVSVFRGTPPAKPLKCKFVSNRLGALFSDLWADPTGGKPRLSCALIRLALSDIIETSLCYCSQTVHLSLPPFSPSVSGK